MNISRRAFVGIMFGAAWLGWQSKDYLDQVNELRILRQKFNINDLTLNKLLEACIALSEIMSRENVKEVIRGDRRDARIYFLIDYLIKVSSINNIPIIGLLKEKNGNNVLTDDDLLYYIDTVDRVLENLRIPQVPSEKSPLPGGVIKI